MNVANLGRIGDEPVFGACRPGHFGADLAEWTDLLVERGVTGVVCLLSEREAGRWGVPAAYEGTFETAHVPIRDQHLPDADRLSRAVGHLERMTDDDGRAAIHCNAGLGRTVIVAAGWLVRERDHTPRSAIETVETRPWPRSPLEAIRDGNATEAELYDLLEAASKPD